MKNIENSQPSSKIKYARKEGAVAGCLTLINTNDNGKTWLVKCNKCNSEFTLSTSTLTRYFNGTYQKCSHCPKEYTPSATYQSGNIIGSYKILEYRGNERFRMQCLKCGYEFDMTPQQLRNYKNKPTDYCKNCKKPSYNKTKYQPGEIIGNCYELVEFQGGNCWLVKCIKCGKIQEQSIPNMKKHTKDTCFYCEHPNSDKPAVGRTRFQEMPIDERIYYYYKGKIEKENAKPNSKYKEWNLTLEEYSKLIHGNCYYCGEPPTDDNIWNKSSKRQCDKELIRINGVDRIDSDKGYVIDNCVSCCPTCNSMKSTFNIHRFLHQIEKIHNFRKGSTTSFNNVASSECETESTQTDNAEGNDMV